MCSVEEDDSVLLAQKKENEHEDNNGVKICFKCKQTDAVLTTRVNDAMCKECFRVYTTHKFRAAIGKSKLIRDGEMVLVAFSGGQASSTLLHLIEEGLSERAHKKLRFRPALLYVDEGAVINMDENERKEIIDRVNTISKKSGFPLYTVSLEEVLQNSTDFCVSSEFSSCTSDFICDSERSDITSLCEEKPQQLNKSEQPNTSVESLFSSFKSLSAKEEFLRLLKQRIFYSVAKKNCYSKIMTGDCSTRLSIRMLTDIAQGRGAQAALDTCFADNRDADVTLLRPLRDFSAKDVAMYNVLFGVESCFTPSLATKAAPTASIEHMTESFVTGLQADFPSTVSNIMRTAEKLGTIEKSKEDHCSLCKAPLDTDVTLASALTAVEYSRAVSKRVEVGLCETGTECCGEGDGSCRTGTVSSITAEELKSTLCYSCRITVGEIKDGRQLPHWLTDGVARDVRRSKMKTEIQEYLIDS